VSTPIKQASTKIAGTKYFIERGLKITSQYIKITQLSTGENMVMAGNSPYNPGHPEKLQDGILKKNG
jgi:hypothetical protein